MGFAIAMACEKMGWDVVLVSGPVQIANPLIHGRVINVQSANEMLE
jgi:phosphopantothenoylcysteine synthetase/decarboxylase